MSPHDPVEFHYDADTCLLRPAFPKRFTAQVNHLGKSGSVDLDKPVWALAAFHHKDRFVRLRFLPSQSATHRIRIELEYKIPGQPASELNFAVPFQKRARSKGMLEKIAEAILLRFAC